MKNLHSQGVCHCPDYDLYNKEPHNISGGNNVNFKFLIMKHGLYHPPFKGFLYNPYASS